MHPTTQCTCPSVSHILGLGLSGCQDHSSTGNFSSGIVLFQPGTSGPSALPSVDQAYRLAELMSLSKAREC